MQDNEFAEYDGLGLAALVRQGDLTPKELVNAALSRISRLNPQINAVVVSMAEDALNAANQVDRSAPFARIPFLLKDFAAQTKGSATTSGAKFFANSIAPADSELVARYRRAGLLIVGKTNTPEMALSSSTEPAFYGPTRNPYDLTRSAGGSSGGSAAAVAARLVPMAHATDGAGSIRIPAAACGLVGLKVSRGRISMGPYTGESLGGAATENALTRTVRDCAALLDISAGSIVGDPYAAPTGADSYLAETEKSPGRLRIALSLKAPYPCEVASECRDAAEATAQICAEMGHYVELADPPIEIEELDRAFMVAMSVNVAGNIATRAQGRRFGPDDFEPVTWATIERGRSFSGTDYLQAIQSFHRLSRLVAPFFSRYDLLLTPTLASLPPPLGWLDTKLTDLDEFFRRAFSFAPFARPWNAAGQPAISLPLHWTDTGLPVGVQFVARYGEEATLIRLSAELERAHPWVARRPPGFD